MSDPNVLSRLTPFSLCVGDSNVSLATPASAVALAPLAGGGVRRIVKEFSCGGPNVQVTSLELRTTTGNILLAGVMTFRPGVVSQVWRVLPDGDTGLTVVTAGAAGGAQPYFYYIQYADVPASYMIQLGLMS